MDQRFRIIIADDQPKVRHGLRLLLEREDEVVVLGEAANASELLDLIGTDCPDLLLLDWGLPGMLGAELMDYLRGICPQINIIALSGRPEVEPVALECGALSFISKADPPENLLQVMFSLLLTH